MVTFTACSLFSNQGKVVPFVDVDSTIRKVNNLAIILDNRISGHTFVSNTLEQNNGYKRPYTVGEGEDGLALCMSEVLDLIKLRELSERLKLAKEIVSNERLTLNDISLEDFCALKGLEYPQLQPLEDYLATKGIVKPELPVKDSQPFSEKEATAGLDVRTQARLLTLNATAAAIGTCIHPDGSFASAREELMATSTAPSQMQAVGQVAVITSKRPTVSLERVNEVFFGLQKRHRELETEGNRIKSSLKQKQREDLLAKNQAYRKALDGYKAKLNAYNEALECYHQEQEVPYRNRLTELKEELKVWRSQELMALANISVSIPDDLTAILDKVMNR